jgi:hypothetical protein
MHYPVRAPGVPVVLRCISCAIAGILLLAHPARGQSVEAWGGLTLVAANLDASLTTSYVPLIQSYSTPLAGSTAGQTVEVLAGNTLGFGAGLNVFFSPHVGVQFLFDTDSRDLSGSNGNYTVLLNYAARQPPDYVERAYSVSSTFEPCDASATTGCVRPTTGALRQRTLGFNLVGRWQAGRHATAELSGGLSYHDVRGDAESLRYSSFRMGGHSTIFSEEYQLAYSVGPAHGLGFDAGASLDIGLGRAMALTVDARYVGGSSIAAPVVVTEVTNQDSLVFLEDVSTIQQNLHPPDVDISPARFRVLVGVKVRY